MAMHGGLRRAREGGREERSGDGATTYIDRLGGQDEKGIEQGCPGGEGKRYFHTPISNNIHTLTIKTKQIITPISNHIHTSTIKTKQIITLTILK
jgi:hypothetical protein